MTNTSTNPQADPKTPVTEGPAVKPDTVPPIEEPTPKAAPANDKK